MMSRPFLFFLFYHDIPTVLVLYPYRSVNQANWGEIVTDCIFWWDINMSGFIS